MALQYKHLTWPERMCDRTNGKPACFSWMKGIHWMIHTPPNVISIGSNGNTHKTIPAEDNILQRTTSVLHSLHHHKIHWKHKIHTWCFVTNQQVFVSRIYKIWNRNDAKIKRTGRFCRIAKSQKVTCLGLECSLLYRCKGFLPESVFAREYTPMRMAVFVRWTATPLSPWSFFPKM